MSKQRMPSLSVSSRIIGKDVRELTVRINPRRTPVKDWNVFPPLLDDIFKNPTAKELVGMAGAKEFAKLLPPEADRIFYSRYMKDKPEILEVRFMDEKDDIVAISGWSRTEGFSFRRIDPVDAPMLFL